MRTLIELIMRVTITGAFGAGLGYVLFMAYDLAFGSGVFDLSSANAMTGLSVGALVGGVIGFFKKH